MYKQLLGDHRKITDKYKSVEKDLAFTKSKCPLIRISFVCVMSCLGSNLFLRAAEAKKQMDRVLKESDAVKGKFCVCTSDWNCWYVFRVCDVVFCSAEKVKLEEEVAALKS